MSDPALSAVLREAYNLLVGGIRQGHGLCPAARVDPDLCRDAGRTGAGQQCRAIRDLRRRV